MVALSLVSAGQAKYSEVDYLRALGGLGMGDSGSGMDAVQTCKGAKVQNVKPGLRMVAACSRACLEVGTAPRAVLGDYRVRSTDLEGGREANRYPPNPIRYFRHLVGAWFTASSCGGGQGEALPLPEAARLARSANPTRCRVMKRERKGEAGSGYEAVVRTQPSCYLGR